MALTVKLAKKISGVLEVLYPVTIATAVKYEDSLSVKDALDAAVESIADLEDTLCLNTIYMQSSDGTIVTDDDGTGVVAVAGLTGVESA